jgi:hypothetical protein
VADPTAAAAAAGEMTVSRGEPVRRPTDHADHDPLLVAEAADRGGRLPATLATCPDCVALHADLVHLAASIPLSPVPARPRAYTLAPADAARLRPAGWRRWLAAIGTSRDAVTRPLAFGLTTIGLAGLLVATVPGFLPTGAGTAGASAVDENYDASEVPPASGAPALAAPEAPERAGAASPNGERDVSGEADASTSDGVAQAAGGTVGTGTDESGAEVGSGTALTEDAAATATSSGPDVLIIVAGTLLVTGMALFGLRWSGRRLASR